MGKKRSVKKNEKFSHEMFRPNAMTKLAEKVAWDDSAARTFRVPAALRSPQKLDIEGNLGAGKFVATLEDNPHAYRLIRDLTEDQRIILRAMYLSRNNVDEYYKLYDTILYGAIAHDAFDADSLDAFIKICIDHCGTPGLDHLGDKAEAECYWYMRSTFTQLAALFRWRIGGRQVYSLSAGLATMLQHTKLDNIPSEFIRCPFESLYLTIPKGYLSFNYHNRDRTTSGRFSDVFLDGILITETSTTSEDMVDWEDAVMEVMMHNPSRTGLKLERVISMDKMALVEGGSKRVIAMDKRPLVVPVFEGEDFNVSLDMVSKMLTGKGFSDEEILSTMESFQLAASALLYATTKDADVVLSSESPLYSKWAKMKADEKEMKRLTKKQRKGITQALSQATSTRTHFLGGGYVLVDRHGNADIGDTPRSQRKPTAMHYRQGHFRIQPFGPRENPEYRRIFIAPQIVGKGAPLQHKPHHMR